MPRIIVEASAIEGAVSERAFSERIVTENLQSGHYNSQLLERLLWAVGDAEARELGEPARRPPRAVPERAMESIYFG